MTVTSRSFWWSLVVLVVWAAQALVRRPSARS